MISIRYTVQGAGWAVATISNGHETVEAEVSYLHDTLHELSDSTLQLINGSSEARVVFMDEPGEYQLRLNKVSQCEILYSVLWFDDWESWAKHPSDSFRDVLNGTCTIDSLQHQVATVLREILETLGDRRYEELWCEHEFPIELYYKLVAA